MSRLIFRLRFHVTTIFVGFLAGLAFQLLRQHPHWERDRTYMFWLPALVALIMWIRTGIANWSNDQADDVTMLLLLAEKLLVAYFAFGIGLGLSFLAA